MSEAETLKGCFVDTSMKSTSSLGTSLISSPTRATTLSGIMLPSSSTGVVAGTILKSSSSLALK